MDRRTFVKSTLLLGGAAAFPSLRIYGKGLVTAPPDAYDVFRAPDASYHPFVRWWWNGNKVRPSELVRELRLLKEAGIGGVEINPVKFPGDTDDLGIASLEWLSDEWIDMLKVAFDECKRLGLTCDLIVGSGWPFGGMFLEGDERAQMMVIGVKKLQGPMRYETSVFNLLREADPAIQEPYAGRTAHLVALKLVENPLTRLEGITDISEKISDDNIYVDIPAGSYALYALVRMDSFGSVINGAPGSDGPALNHLNRAAVEKYLTHMSDAIARRIGSPLSEHMRAFFVDGWELDGANWISDMPEVFKRRNGYDIMPYLPLTMYKMGGMGSVADYRYGADMSPELRDMFNRMHYDVEVTEAEMFRDRFCLPFAEWCRRQHVLSRVQAYGRGFFPLESSMYVDIPEGESWTTNWLQHRIGEEMSNEDYRRGRAYTMVNKYVTSAAHLTGKRLVSNEEMTNTYRVFNMTLEFLKLGCDQNTIVGITHSVLHGFSYSPPEAPFPGWIRYGAYYNENNNWWPYFRYFNEYRARVCSIVQNADMYTDVAVLPPLGDQWSTLGMQNEPFPAVITAPYQSLLWEAMNKNGNGVDYVSEPIIREAKVSKGWLHCGKRKYSSLFLIETERIDPDTLAVLHKFVAAGGKVFCIEKYPSQSLGWNSHAARDEEVRRWVEKLKAFPNRFVLLRKPDDNDFVRWYPAVQRDYGVTPFVTIADPNPYVMVNRYLRDDSTEVFFFINSHLHNDYRTTVTFPPTTVAGKYPWVWDLDTGKRYRIELDRQGAFGMYLGPVDSRVIVFDREAKGAPWRPLPVTGDKLQTLEGWDVELRHSIEKTQETTRMEKPTDLKDTKYVHFTGTAVYRKTITVPDPEGATLNLGKVYGLSEVKINGVDCGVTWYGNRLYDVSGKLRAGKNEVEIHVVTTMGNYMKTLTGNKVAQRWVNRPGRPQPIQSMGLVGPVTLYQSNINNNTTL
ncbi:MAG: glycoside hydrolase family 2 [Prevotellaceae bacterium]|nr:glycoside hydrolase family 2 [Prevotellaceae bacterium]